jgi:hypothetical protein
VVVVVCVCVLLLVTVLTVGVVRLRAAHKRAAEEEVEMAWDDTALNITVNPLEVSYTLITVLRIRIRVFLGLLAPDSDPLVRDLDPDPDPSIIKQK